MGKFTKTIHFIIFIKLFFINYPYLGAGEGKDCCENLCPCFYSKNNINDEEENNNNNNNNLEEKKNNLEEEKENFEEENKEEEEKRKKDEEEEIKKEEEERKRREEEEERRQKEERKRQEEDNAKRLKEAEEEEIRKKREEEQERIKRLEEERERQEEEERIRKEEEERKRQEEEEEKRKKEEEENKEENKEEEEKANNNNDNENNENKDEREYSYDCINSMFLSIYIYQGTDKVDFEIYLKNSGNKTWANDSKLLVDPTSKCKVDEIILDPQKPNVEKGYPVTIKDLKNYPEGEYKIIFWFYSGGKIHGEKIVAIIRIKEKDEKKNEIDENIDKIQEFRDTFNLSEDEYPNEKILEILKENDFNYENAFSSLFN